MAVGQAAFDNHRCEDFPAMNNHHASLGHYPTGVRLEEENAFCLALPCSVTAHFSPEIVGENQTKCREVENEQAQGGRARMALPNNQRKYLGKPMTKRPS